VYEDTYRAVKDANDEKPKTARMNRALGSKPSEHKCVPFRQRSTATRAKNEPEDYVVRYLIDRNEIDYDAHADLLYKHAGQVVAVNMTAASTQLSDASTEALEKAFWALGAPLDVLRLDEPHLREDHNSSVLLLRPDCISHGTEMAA
jgi:hypothetical protein